MEMDVFSVNKERIIQYLQAGCKSCDMPLHFGVELEHFMVHGDSKEAVLYEGIGGVESILKELMPYYENSTYSQGHLIALARDGIALSLEPAAQLEVSISPQTDIFRIKKIYDDFYEEIRPILQKYSYELMTVGYQPKSKVDELGLLPKARYEYMDRYFNKIGPWGKRMMRGTASTQVSIDYYSEEDFMKKYRIAYYLKDTLAMIFSNTSVFEAEEYTGHNLRSVIWAGTDAKRVDVFPYMKEGTLSFEAYADFVLQTPIIVNKKEEQESYDERTIGEIAGERIFSQEELTQVLSMVFPMIRAKQFLELRFADSMPMERVLFYVLVMKGLFTDVDDTWTWLNGVQLETMTCAEQLAHITEKIAGSLSKEENKYIKDYGVWL